MQIKEYIGNVVWFSRVKKYGFVMIDSIYKKDKLLKREIFFHHKSVLPVNGRRPMLKKGDIVIFEVRKKNNQIAAYDLKYIMS